MKYLTSQTVGMSGSVYLSSASTGQEIKGVPVAGPEPRAWGTSSWARAVPLACQVIPGALGHRRGIEGAIHVGDGSVGSHHNRGLQSLQINLRLGLSASSGAKATPAEGT